MTITDALNYIHSVSWKGSVPGLSRTQELLRRMGNPEKKLKFIHVAGTNGKGSTAAMLASIFRAAGYRTGLYTSPYLLRFNDRMRVDGSEITDSELCRITEFVKPLAETMEDIPTEFELVSAIAFQYFYEMQCGIVILEVGMGGELDSTNVIEPPEVAVICNIGLDHTEYLGTTLPEIAAAKAGIIKRGSTAVIYRAAAEVEAVFEEKCRTVGSKLKKADFGTICPVSHDLGGQVFNCGDRRNLSLSLLGAHQLRNAAVALAAVDAMRDRGWLVPESAVRQGLSNVKWAGRFEVLRRDPLFIVDGGHNPQCMEALALNIRDYLEGRRLTVLTGVLRDKDYGCMYPPVAPFAAEFFTVTPDSPRALGAAELGEYLAMFHKPVTVCATVREGVAAALRAAGKDGVVLAYGSLYMAGDIIRAVEKTK